MSVTRQASLKLGVGLPKDATSASYSDAINVTVDVSSYKQHSETIKEIVVSYEGLLEENAKLRERITKLKAAHDKETNVMKHAQFVQADRDM